MTTSVETVTVREAQILRAALAAIRALAAVRDGSFSNTVWAIAEKAIADESAENLAARQRARRR